MILKLESGKEYDVKDLTFKQRVKIKQKAMECSVKGIPCDLESLGEAVCYGLGLKFPDDLDKWDDKEIWELGTLIFNQLYLSETDKKK